MTGGSDIFWVCKTLSSNTFGYAIWSIIGIFLGLLMRKLQALGPGGGGTSLWVRRGCAPVLGSFWPENSGIGVSFYWKISVIGGYSKFCNGC